MQWSRREFLASAGVAALASTPMSALAAPTPIVKPAGRTGQALPAIGLGTFLTFDLLPGEPREHLNAVMREFWDGGGRVIDTSPLYGSGETSVGDFASALGITDRLFIANKIWATGEYLADTSQAQRSLDQSLSRLWRRQIDLMQCHSLVNADVIVPLLRAWKKEGVIRFVGISHHESAHTDMLASWVERDVVDFVQVNYSMYSRGAEARLLSAALERGVAVITNMPFEKSRLFELVKGQALPGFAAEIGASSWAQYFLKWVISHPAVTCALPATADPKHARDNVGAMYGELPDAKLRTRMLDHVMKLPGFKEIGARPWYPDKAYSGLIGRAQAELRARQ